ncbi:MAG: hypothetical protein H0W02_03010 [Ktedonobacteraceae bacterium]|nr:hypothetical protein [Ktedonobacteraceae bacterium]
MKKTASSNEPHLHTLLERYANRIFILIIVVGCFLLYYFGPLMFPHYKDVIISFTTSLFASLIFAVFYSSIVERHHMTVINDELAQNVRQAIEEMKELQQENSQKLAEATLKKIEEIEQSYYYEISHHFRGLIPSNSFPPANEPDLRFNTMLNLSLKASRFYLFKGVTGRYVPSRLALADRRNLACRFLLVDPRHVDLLRLYVRDRFGASLSTEATKAHIDKVRRETAMTIVDLFSLARITPVEIKMYQGPVFYRTEIVDEFFLISYFAAQTSTAFPTTYQYHKESFFYDAFLTDFNQTFELASPTASFNSKSEEQELLNFLTSLGYELDSVSELRQEAEHFRETFLQQIQP